MGLPQRGSCACTNHTPCRRPLPLAHLCAAPPQTTAHTPSTLLPATAASDAEAGGDADGGKRQRMAGESQAEQQAQQASVEVEAH